MELNSVYYVVVKPQIIYETIDNDTVIIDLSKGHYYSLNNLSSIIWNLVTQGCSVDKVIEELSRICNTNKNLLIADVENFLASLEKDGLLKKEINETAHNNVTIQTSSLKYEKPSYTVYTDLEALLLADPVHEL